MPKNLRFLVLIRSRSSNRILYRPVNGREISISVFGRTRRTRLYLLKSGCYSLNSARKYVLTSSNDSLACALLHLGPFWSLLTHHLSATSSILPYCSSLSMLAVIITAKQHTSYLSLSDPSGADLTVVFISFIFIFIFIIPL